MEIRYVKLVETTEELDGIRVCEAYSADEDINKMKWDAYAEGRKDQLEELKPVPNKRIRILHAKYPDPIEFAREIERAYRGD
jgi:hypothetical protein